MSAPTPSINPFLIPLSFLYRLGVSVRNALFSCGFLKEREFPEKSVICIGNLTVGGTGKTPHIEYLIRLLQRETPTRSIAVLSRGYGRKTKGFLLADAHSTAREIGDEPYQMHQKFPEITVAVSEKRVEGIENLSAKIILLDDAFQHRYVKAGLNILLTDFHRLMTRDALLPAGRLREPLGGKERAHLILITKCPELSPKDKEELREEMKVEKNQHLFFSSIRYGNPEPVFPEAPAETWESIRQSAPRVLLLAGIANPGPLKEEIERRGLCPMVMEFRDHHTFTAQNLVNIEQKSKACPILTTEKDAARLKSMTLSSALKKRIYQIPIQVKIESDRGEDFDQLILRYVNK